MWKINEAPTLNEALSDIPDIIEASKTKRNKNQRLDPKTDKDELERLYTTYHNQNGTITAQQKDILTDEKRQCIWALYSETYDKADAKLPNIRQALFGKISHCPYCGFGEPTTLDHYLPKARYQALATCRLNLVPACRECNTLKDEDTLIPHPYYESYPPGIFFFVCSVNWTGCFYTFRFHVDPGKLPKQLENKINGLIKAVNLSNRLCREVNSFIHDELHDAEKLPDDKIKKFIMEKADYYASTIGKNHWKTAALRGLAECAALSRENIQRHTGAIALRDAAV